MEPNIAAWMISGGPRLQADEGRREREQLHAYLEGHRATEGGPGLIERIRDLLRQPEPVEPACCPA